MKFNLQQFAQVKDAFGKELVEKKKKKIIPVITPPKVTSKPIVPVTPFISGNESAKLRDPNLPFSVENPGTFEQGVQFRKDEAAKLAAGEKKVVLADVGLTGSEVVSTTPVVPVGPTPEELNARLVATGKQNAIDSLNRAFGISQGRLNQEEGAVAGEFRTKESDVRTRDTMARAAKGKFLDIGGLGKAGQVGQTALGQNVITQGAIGQLNQQELAQRADIQRRRTELVVAREQGIADINSAIEIQEIESKLRSAEAQAEYAREKEVLTESREYDDYLRQVELADDREIALFEQQLDERNKALDFEIDIAVKNNDFANLVELTKEKAALDLQELAIRQAGDRRLEGQRQAGRTDLETQKQEGRELLASDKDEAEDAVVDDLFPDSTFTSGITKRLQGTDEFTPVEDINNIIISGLIEQGKNGSIVNDLQLIRILKRYDLDEADVDAFIAAENQAKTDRITSQLPLN